MTGNTHALGIDLGEIPKDGVRKVLRDVGGHAVIFGPGGLGGVDIEAGAGTEVFVVVFAGDVQAAWGGFELKRKNGFFIFFFGERGGE